VRSVRRLTALIAFTRLSLMPGDPIFVATVGFSDLVDGVVKLGALVLVAYALTRLLPVMRQRGFTAKIFGNEVKLNGPTDAVETLSATFKKQIDDLRAQLTALQSHGQTTALEAAEAMAPGRSSARTALWVDDTPENNLFEVGKLNEAGFEVVQVRSTEEAVTRLRQEQFDLVVTDMGRNEHGREVPDAGLRLIDWIRTREREENRPQVPVFMYCSVWAVEHFSQEAVARGATGITSSTTTLLQGIQSAFGGQPQQ
jgi:CheY-like chemotaxis protein/acetolactate synthase regulatory subunit